MEEEECEEGLEGSYLKQAVGACLGIRLQDLQAPLSALGAPPLPWHIIAVNGWKANNNACILRHQAPM